MKTIPIKNKNGPLLQHADKLLKRAMDKYWNNTTEIGAWHFVKKREQLMCTKSKVFSILVTKRSKLGFMDEYQKKMKSTFVLLLKYEI